MLNAPNAPRSPAPSTRHTRPHAHAHTTHPPQAYAELRGNAIAFGAICLVARLTPYVLHALQKASSS